MSNNWIRNREGKIIGRMDGNWLRDGTGKLLARYDKFDDRTRSASGKIMGPGDQRLRALGVEKSQNEFYDVRIASRAGCLMKRPRN